MLSFFVACMLGQAMAAQPSPLIPRDKFFTHGERMRVRLSPDGKWIGWVTTIKDANGVPHGLGIFRAPVDDLEKVETVLADGERRIPAYAFSTNPRYMYFLRDVGGNENMQLYVIDLETKSVTNLTGNTDVKTDLEGELPDHPGPVYFTKNERDPEYADTFKYDPETKQTTVVYQNDKEKLIGVMLDDDGRPRLGMRYNAAGHMEYLERRGEDWHVFLDIAPGDVTNTHAVGFDWRKDLMYLVDGRGEDKASFKSLNLRTGELVTLKRADKADIEDVLTDYAGRRPLAVVSEYMRKDVLALDEQTEAELAKLRQLDRGDITVMSKTKDDSKWLVLFAGDTKSPRYYLWDRQNLVGRLIFSMQPEMDALPLAPMQPLVIKSRDGLDLVSYLTLPAWVDGSKPAKPLPMVLLVHGGPWARDHWGLNAEHQWLANRGYAVLSVNFRGSTGFGKSFVSASYGQWGAKMHDDLIDARQWAIEQGIADPANVAIMGTSYGGYAALAGAAFTPDVFKASVDIVGVANLITMAENIPPYWKAFRTNQIIRIGADVETAEGRAFLWSRSPLSRVNDIRIPLLIAHGDNDQRVKLSESTQIVEAMQAAGLPVTFVRFPDEGHGFQRPENQQSFRGTCEAFLATNLGGRAEPVRVVPGTTMSVPVGAEHIPGLKELLGGS